MAKGICVKKKYTISEKKQTKKTATIKGNESTNGYWSRDLADKVIVYVLNIFLLISISCTGVNRGLFELGCLGPSVSIAVLSSHTGSVL